MKKIIALIKGGLGNQMFCYAAARRLAIANNAELLIDDVTGFLRDKRYQRRYALNHFRIPVVAASPLDRLEPFGRYRRSLLKLTSRSKPFDKRRYLEQEGMDFDVRMLSLRIDEWLYLDGYWQSEGYFKDVERIIRSDLEIIPPTDVLNQVLASKIGSCNAVAVHIRWFDVLGGSESYNVSASYYQRAIQKVEESVECPHYFLFSDDPEAAYAKLSFPANRVTLVSHNLGDESAYADLWLMTLCRHF
mgnify:CR=1 FL=1